MCCGLKSASIRCLLPHLFWLIASVGPDQRGSQKSTSGKAELCYTMSMLKKQTRYETLLSSLPLTLSHFARKIHHNVKSDEKTPDRPRSCLLCATSAFFGKRLGTAGTSDLGSLGCFGNVWSSLVFFFFFFSPRHFLLLSTLLQNSRSCFQAPASCQSQLLFLPPILSFHPLSLPATSCEWHCCTGTVAEAGNGGRDVCVRTYHSWNYGSFQFGCGWLHHLLSPREWSLGWWFQP